LRYPFLVFSPFGLPPVITSFFITPYYNGGNPYGLSFICKIQVLQNRTERATKRRGKDETKGICCDRHVHYSWE
jgi:hypothetical protein